MSETEHPERPSRQHRPVHPVLWLMILVMIALEAASALSHEFGISLWGGRLSEGYPEDFGLPVRAYLYTWLAYFTPGTESFQFPDFENGIVFELEVLASPLWSTTTYAFLHGNWLHLAMNGAVFLGLGHAISQAAGIRAALVIFVLTAIAGALAFGLISPHAGPMVGASGAVFGYFGTFTAWQERALARAGASRQPIWGRVIGLIVINVLLSLGLGGLLAWEAHLGGFVMGWVLAYAYPPVRAIRGLP